MWYQTRLDYDQLPARAGLDKNSVGVGLRQYRRDKDSLHGREMSSFELVQKQLLAQTIDR